MKMSCLQLAPVVYAFPVQTRQFNEALTSLRTSKVAYFRRNLPMISLKSTSLIRRNQLLSTMCSLNSASLTSDYREPEPTRLFEGEGVSKNGNEVMSIEDLIKEQIQNKEYGGNGGGKGRKPPGGGGGSGDESMWDGEEFKQVTFATLGIIFVCIYIAERAQINALAKDSLQYLFTGKQSARLKRIIEPFKKFVQSMRGEEYHDQNEIIRTPDDHHHYHDNDDIEDDDD